MNKRTCQRIIGKRLKEIRIKHNVTPKEMSEIMDVPLSKYKSFEKGRGTIMLSHAIRIATHFQISMDYIAGEKTGDTE